MTSSPQSDAIRRLEQAAARETEVNACPVPVFFSQDQLAGI
jgi:hypothetical protein